LNCSAPTTESTPIFTMRTFLGITHMKAVIKGLMLSMLACGLAHAAEAGDVENVRGHLETAVTETPEHTFTGYVGVLSSYNLRGITNAPESDTPALQGSIDYSHASGFYAGYWFSTLSYNYANLNPDADGSDERKSLESDFYAGYKGTSGDIGYQVGGTIYYYYPGWESTGYETMLGLSYGDYSLTAQTLLNDVTYGNAGDTYFVASYSHALPMDFTFTGKLGAYLYKKDGDFAPETADSVDAGFRHLILGVTHPLAATGATMGLDMIVGGYDRYDVKQDNKLVASVSMSF
jgi:uncharacterized protein (TIGR02001 family)